MSCVTHTQSLGNAAIIIEAQNETLVGPTQHQHQRLHISDDAGRLLAVTWAALWGTKRIRMSRVSALVTTKDMRIIIRMRAKPTHIHSLDSLNVLLLVDFLLEREKQSRQLLPRKMPKAWKKNNLSQNRGVCFFPGRADMMVATLRESGLEQ